MTETTPPDANKETIDFGYTEVPREQKAGMVKAVFDSVADNYDVMNDLMSMGIHRLWKRYLIGTAGIRPGHRVLDLAGGTGDIAALINDKIGERGQVVLADINAAMLRNGRSRMLDRGLLKTLDYAQVNAECLPFADNSFDFVTMGFGLRNVTDKAAALRSIARVLRPGGRVLVLEFSQVTVPPLKKLYDFYSFNILPKIGEVVAKDRDSYQYLAESIRKHPDQETLRGMMEEAGLTRCRYENLTGGIVAIHSGYKV